MITNTPKTPSQRLPLQFSSSSKYLHSPNSSKLIKMMTLMMIKTIRNGVLGISAPRSANFSLDSVRKSIGFGSVSVYMSKTHQAGKPDRVFPALYPSRRNLMPNSAASFDVEAECDDEARVFENMKTRFLSFKENTYRKDLKRYKTLAVTQNPKVTLLIHPSRSLNYKFYSCRKDSRVCPSNILGFQPGEAFMVRNVANLVPRPKHGPSETIAALEFAVNTLQVEHIFVIGHSCCAGIETLMKMEDSTNPSFTEKWVAAGKEAKLSSVSAANNLNFDRLCKHCEKESINHSMRNLTLYPWIAEKVKQKRLSIHGGYYDFVRCSFEKWSMDLRSLYGNEGSSWLIKDREFWS